MAIATCWNCGAGLNGPRCQWCGAAQTPEAAQGSSSRASAPQAPASSYGPGASAGQLTGWQNQRTIASQPEGWQASPTIPGQMSGWQAQPPAQGYQQPMPGQPGDWQAQPTMASQPGGWQASQAAPGQMGGWQSQPLQGYQPSPGYQQPMPGPVYPGMQPAASAARPKARSDAASLLLGLVGGLIGGIIGALIWAAILNATNFNISYIAIGLGILVGYGVALGTHGQVTTLPVILAGVLGLLAFFLALYFRVSYWEGYGFAGLPLGDFTSAMGDYLQANPLNYLYFVLVPLMAAGAAYGGQGQRRTARRR